MGSSPWVWPLLGVQGPEPRSSLWEFLPQSPELTRHIQSQEVGSAVSRLPEEGLGGGGGEKGTGKNRGAQVPLLASPASGGAGRGTGGWNPEQRVEELLAFTSIVLVHTAMVQKLFGC